MNSSYIAIKEHAPLFPVDTLTRLSEAKAYVGFCAATAKNGDATFSFEKNGKRFFMHSAYDPSLEAQTLAKDVARDTEVDVIAIVGIGAGHLVRAVTRLRPDARVVAIEPSYETFRFIVDSFDLSDIFANERVIYFIGENQIKDIEDYLSTFVIKKMKVIATRGYYALFPDLVSAYQRDILDIVDKKAININTIARFERLWAYNIMSNIGTLPFVYGINRFFKKFKNVPAIVVSAGPSLEKNIHLLKEAKAHALIIAVDTALKPLAYRGITPHFAVAIDPQLKNAKYFRGVDTDRSILIAEASIHNEIIRNYRGPIYAVESIFPFAKEIMKTNAPHGEVTMGGSVSTSAFDFALRIGANPVIMVGLDLSFPSHATHVKGSYHEEDFFTQVGKLDTFESRIYRVLVKGNLRREKNAYGEDVFIDSRFSMYRNLYVGQAKNADAKLYNATEGGVAIEGFETTTLEEALRALPKRKIDLSPYYEDAALSGEKRNAAKARLLAALHGFEDDVRAIERLLAKALDALDALDAAIRRNGDINALLSALDTIDAEMQRYPKAKEFVGMTMQRAINLITGEYALTDEEGETEATKSSRFLYRQMAESAAFNARCLLMGRKILERTMD